MGTKSYAALRLYVAICGMMILLLPDLEAQTKAWQIRCDQHIKDTDYVAALRVIDSLRSESVAWSTAERAAYHNYGSLCYFYMGRTQDAVTEAWASYKLEAKIGTYLRIHTFIMKSREAAHEHLLNGLLLFREHPLITMELSDHYMMHNNYDSSVYWLRKSVDAGVTWDRYISRYRWIQDLQKAGYINEKQVNQHIDEWSHWLFTVFFHTYEALPQPLRSDYLKQNTPYLKDCMVELLAKAAGINTEESVRKHYCGLLSDVLIHMTQLRQDTAAFGDIVWMMTEVLYANTGREHHDCYESLMRAMIPLLHDAYPDRKALYAPMYRLLMNVYITTYRLEEAAHLAYHQIENMDRRNEKGPSSVDYYETVAVYSFRQGKYLEALQCMYEARRLCDSSNVVLRLQLTKKIATALHYTGRRDEAVRETMSAIPLAEELNDDEKAVLANELLEIGSLLQSFEAHEEAIQVLSNATNALKYLPNTKEYNRLRGIIHYRRATSLINMQQISKAVAEVENAWQYVPLMSAEHDEMYESIRLDYILVMIALNRLEDVRQNVAEWLYYIDTHEHDNTHDPEYNIRKMGVMLLAVGDIITADKVLRRLSRYDELRKQDRVVEVSSKYIAAKYAQLSGRLQSAARAYREIVFLYEDGNIPLSSTLADALKDLAIVTMMTNGDPSESLEKYRHYSEILRARPDTAFALIIGAYNAWKSEDYASIRDLLQERQALIGKSPLSPYASGSVHNRIALAWLSYYLGDTASTDHHLEILLKDVGMPNLMKLQEMAQLWPIYLYLMKERKGVGYSAEIASQALDTLEIFYAASAEALTETEATKYYNMYCDFLNHLSSVCVNGACDGENYKEISNRDEYRRGFYKTYRGALIKTSNSEDGHSKRLRQEVVSVQGEIEMLASRAAIPQDKRRSQMLNLYDKLHDLQKQLRRLTAASGMRNDAAPITRDMVKVLKTGEASVRVVATKIKRLHESDSTVYLAIVQRHDGMMAHTVLPQGRLLDSLWYAEYIAAVKGRRPDDLAYVRYWKPIDRLLGDVRTVYLLPDGVYAKINIETMMDDDSRYVADLYDIVVLTDFSEKTTVNSSATGRSATLIGYPDYASTDTTLPLEWSPVTYTRAPELDTEIGRGYTLKPLPGTMQEIIGIDSLMQTSSWRTHVFIGREATKENLRSAPPSAIIHIATHGFFARRGQGDRRSRMDFLKISDTEVLENPLLSSGLFLAGADKVFADQNDLKTPSTEGVLSAFEISSWDLSKTELVVLSACETGLGYTVPGQSVYGLQRGITTAGAREVVQSLWVVDDAVTRDLMLEMYRQIARNIPYREALQRAKRSIRILHPDPFYWGAFIHVQ